MIQELIVLLFFVLIIGGQYVGLYLLFEKAGEKGWKALIPYYNLYIMTKITGRPWYWILYLLIPIVNVFIIFGLFIDLYRSFGKEKFWELGVGLVFAFVYLPYLGLQKDVTYLGNRFFPRREKG